MPCPFNNSGGSDDRTQSLIQRSIQRRTFLQKTLAVGGASALSACIERRGSTNPPQGTEDPSSLPSRQFEWNRFLPHGPHGNVKLPNHQLLIFLDYAETGRPTPDDRQQVEATLQSLERAYQWGTGDEFNPTSTDGLLFMMGYSSSYFDRFKTELPESAQPHSPEALISKLNENATADSYDAVIVLTSDDVQVLLAAEQALRGSYDVINGVSVDGSFGSVFQVKSRRTGFLGVGRPADELDVDGIDDASPTAMGYRSGFKDNQATEKTVAIRNGPFSNGSTMQISQLIFNLESWYDESEDRRAKLMFSPTKDPDDVGTIGENLAGQSGVTEETVKSTSEHAQEHGVIGHTQKVAASRNKQFKPKLLRRTEGVSTDLDKPGMNFVSLQRDMENFVEVRQAMNGDHIEAEVEDQNNGILDYIEVLRRATYLVPPRSLRALPEPDP